MNMGNSMPNISKSDQEKLGHPRVPMLEPYDQNKHYEMIKSWIIKRNVCGILPPEFFPQIGFVSPGLGAGFLYRTDSALGFAENLISNPDASPFDRDRALNEICVAIVKKAKSVGIKILIAMTEIEAVKKRLLINGCVPTYQNMTLFMRGI